MKFVDSATITALCGHLDRASMYATSLAAHYEAAMMRLSEIQPHDQIGEADAIYLDRSLVSIEDSFRYFAEVMDRWHPEDEPGTSTEQSPPLLTAFGSIRSSKPHDTGSFEPDCLPGPSET